MLHKNFRLTHSNNQITKLSEKGVKKQYEVTELWRLSPNRKSAEKIYFKPSQGITFEEDGSKYVNSFEFKNHDEVVIDIELIRPFLDHFDTLTASRYESDCLLHWLAHIVQKPGEAPSVHPLHISIKQGLGRGSLTKLIQSLIGHWLCKEVKIKDLGANGSRFNSFMHESLVCSIAEISYCGRDNIKEQIKEYLTQDGKTMIEKKGKDAVACEVVTRFFMQSNNANAIDLTEEDRRFNIFVVDKEPMSAEYYTKLNLLIQNDTAVAHFFKYLSSIEITAYDPNRPMVHNSHLLTHYVSDSELMARDWLECREVFKMDQWYDYQRLEGLHDMTKANFKRIYELMGFKSKRVRIDGKQTRVHLTDHTITSITSCLFEEKLKIKPIDTDFI
jgi:hypothetical protein